MVKEYIGLGMIKALGEILTATVPRHIFLVTGKDSYASSGASALVEPYLSGLKYTRFCDFSSNPALEDIEKGIQIFRKISPDIVIAVGGGSVMDMAKAINVLSQNEGIAREYIEGREIIQRGKPLVAIPTTAGSGSEATHFAVAYVNGRKYSLAHHSMAPDWAIADPEFTYRLPKSITAATGMDALSQAIESFWSLRATDESRRYAKEAVALALANLKKAVLHPDEAVREGMSRAAHLSGKAINISKTTASHAMSYPLTVHFGIPHGHAVALTLPKLIIFNDHKEVTELLGAPDAKHAATVVETLMNDIGLSTRLRDFGVHSEDIPNLIEEMSVERAGNNPRPFKTKDAERILHSIL